jgi:hypothetical protein
MWRIYCYTIYIHTYRERKSVRENVSSLTPTLLEQLRSAYAANLERLAAAKSASASEGGGGALSGINMEGPEVLGHPGAFD